jgi:hypothetical protein
VAFAQKGRALMNEILLLVGEAQLTRTREDTQCGYFKNSEVKGSRFEIKRLGWGCFVQVIILHM